MRTNDRVGKYVLVQKCSWVGPDGSFEQWVFMNGDVAIEWDSRKGIPTEADLDPHSGGEC